MNKQEYLAQLRAALACLPEGEIEESVAFYTEMIDDRVADGLTEEEATAQLDDPKAAARAIIADLPVVPRTVVRTKQRNRALYWTLVILGSPLWLTLLLAAGMLVLAGLLTIWCLILGLWLLAAGLLAGGPLGIGVCLWALAVGQPAYGVFELGSGLLCFGLGLFCLHGAVAASKTLMQVSRQWIAKAKAPFVKVKEEGAAAFVGKETVHES
ncbi:MULTISPECIES: DUF1700 domain-containing protein [Adlercreutzia]|jgi:uncharacterized membrane protein|uniref:DUF1700 domain-containing protein n=2 Tax=Adlercreutzia TaxID=447020 RepID=A0A6N8JN31_9ACTN|nr:MULTISPECIES: DUF1700 domain-containing protein [Adlercreutzia]MVX60240.1 DUF1700 domain-containing protein [Adlercreutzia mucosicola]THG35982.1 DUF1700 domain-containing protein [Adlercreutzia caecimuris]